MSQPQRRNVDYGYFPNMADGVVNLESRVTTEGVRMSGKIEKHSEFMEPNNQPYDEMEYVYADPSLGVNKWNTISPISAGQGWPKTESFSVEDYLCRAYGCCCDGGTTAIEVICSYPIIKGPWIKGGDRNCMTTGSCISDPSFDPKPKNKTICVTTATGGCDPEVHCIIKGPTESKEMVMKTLHRKGGDDCACPPSTACCTGTSIGIATTQMNVGGSQSLTVINPVAGCVYGFRIMSGGGTIAEGVYYAPSSNVGCSMSPTIGLYANCQLCATVKIAVNTPGVAGTAYYAGTKVNGQCSAGGGVCSSNAGYVWDKAYTCDGVLVGDAPTTSVSGCPTCNQDPILGNCDTGCGCWTGSGWEVANPCTPNPSKHDVRTEAMKTAGCCPSLL